MNTTDTVPRDTTERRRLLKNPRFWLAVQMVAIVIVGFPLGLWKTQVIEDSVIYINVSQMPLREALDSTRTIAYPLLLRLVAPISPEYAPMPWIHLAVLCAVVNFLDVALRRFGASAWQSFAVSSGFLCTAAFMYAVLLHRFYIAGLIPDYLAVVMAGATMACLFYVVVMPRQIAAWLGLSASLALAYQLRPVYLFLVPLVPCLGLLWLRIYSRRTGQPFRWVQFSLATATASVVPYVAFCLFRLVFLGHFGLVSFAGCTLSGLAVELLDTEMAQRELPEQHRPFAQAVLEQRRQKRLPGIFPGPFRVDMKQFEANLSTNVWYICMPLARRFYGNQLAVYNRQLASFSQAVIRLRPGKYLLWAAWSLPWAVAKLAGRFCLLWVAVPALALLFLVRCKIAGMPKRGTKLAAAYNDGGLLAAMTWLAVLFFLAHQGVLVVAGLYCDSRYMVAAGTFVIPLLVLLALREWTLICAARQLHRRGAE